MSRGAFSPKVRRLVVDRQDGACAVCGDVIVSTLDYTPLKPAEWHHRLPRRSGGRRGPMAKLVASAANCLLVCSPHHHQIESERNQAKSFGWLLDEGQNPYDEPVLMLGVWCLLTDEANVIGLPGGVR